MRAVLTSGCWTSGAVIAIWVAALSTPASAQTDESFAAPLGAPEARAVELHDQAREHYQRGEYRKAIDKLERAIELDPSGAELAYNLGLIHEKLGEVDVAEAHYRHSLELEKDPAMRRKVKEILLRLRGARREVASAAEPSPDASSRESDARWIAAGSVAVSAVLVGSSFATAAVVEDPGGTVETGNGTTLSDLEDRAARAQTFAVAADISFLVGAAAAALTAYFLLDDGGSGSASSPHEASSVAWSPRRLSVRF